MKKIKLLALLLVMGFMVGCERVPPVTKGKILQPAGYEPEILPSGKYWVGWRGEMVLVDTSTDTMKEPMEIIMSDKLTLRFDVKFRVRIRGSDAVINSIFDDIKPIDNFVSLKNVYNVYGKMMVRNQARAVLTQYSVEDVHKNYTIISEQLVQAMLPKLEGTPLELSDVTLGNIQYPDIVTKAVERAEEKRQQIDQEKAQAEIATVKKENELRLAEQDYAIKITRAKATRDENILLSEGITDSLIEIKRLDLLQAIIENPDGNTVFMPIEALTSTGAQIKMFNTQAKNKK